MLKIIQTGVQHYLNHALPVFKLDFEKVEEPQIKVPINFGSQKSKSVPEKHLLLLYWLATTFSCMDHNKLMKILKEMGNQNLVCFHMVKMTKFSCTTGLLLTRDYERFFFTFWSNLPRNQKLLFIKITSHASNCLHQVFCYLEKQSFVQNHIII